ncbi:MAG TPA: segregation/condensation protein A [bacterium]|nr:segregation/condensation protein A [bacterium]
MSDNQPENKSEKGPVEISLSTTTSSVTIQEVVNEQDQRPTYRITLPLFDGPMDLLLHLIKEHELDIYDIPISRITREYLTYLDLMQSLNLEIAGDFLVMAATLMQIKSRMLLPVDPTPDEPQEDPRLELMRRLIEYKKFKDAADQLLEREKGQQKLIPRNVPSEMLEVGEEEHLEEVTLFGLLAAFKDVLIHAQEDVTAELSRPEITVSQKINDLMDVLQAERKLLFRPLMTACRTKIEKIVALLALLELVRLKLVRVFQNKVFGEIEVFLNVDEVPAASDAHGTTE